MFGRAPQQLTIRSEREGHAHVVRLIGELDMDTAPAFDDELKRVEATAAREIVVDLSGLKFIGSDGLKVFIHANARARSGHHRLKLVRGSDQVDKTFETTGLLTRLPFADYGDMRPWFTAI
ncbi:MAG TPA: STAS domain-containing protein [Solirubrobacteraceae bacterium]